jgi:hypothetical protein
MSLLGSLLSFIGFTGTAASQAKQVKTFVSVGTTVGAVAFDTLVPIPTGKGITMRGFHCGRATAGNPGEVSGGTAIYAFKNVGGVITEATTDAKQGPLVTNAVLTGGFQGATSGTNGVYRINGTAGQTIDWTVVIDVIVN